MVVSSRCKSFLFTLHGIGTNEPICSHGGKNWRKAVKMAKSSVLLALNSLSSDGMVRLTTEQHQQFEALVEDYLDESDGSDDEISGSDNEMECGKYLWLTKIHV